VPEPGCSRNECHTDPVVANPPNGVIAGAALLHRYGRCK
jgi:hypothetical protein